MPPARGDMRPCTNAGCVGTMQFGRESDNDAKRAPITAPTRTRAAYDPTGWVCSKDLDHFRKGD